MSLFPIGDIWGIGRRWQERLAGLQVTNALDFAKLSRSFVRSTFNVIAERTWMELNGIDCIPIDDMEMITKKSVCTSRSFPNMLTNMSDIRTHVANYAAKCAQKLRQLHFIRCEYQDASFHSCQRIAKE